MCGRAKGWAKDSEREAEEERRAGAHLGKPPCVQCESERASGRGGGRAAASLRRGEAWRGEPGAEDSRGRRRRVCSRTETCEAAARRARAAGGTPRAPSMSRRPAGERRGETASAQP